jgi:hypothetical protein
MDTDLSPENRAISAAASTSFIDTRDVIPVGRVIVGEGPRASTPSRRASGSEGSRRGPLDSPPPGVVKDAASRGLSTPGS